MKLYFSVNNKNELIHYSSRAVETIGAERFFSLRGIENYISVKSNDMKLLFNTVIDLIKNGAKYASVEKIFHSTDFSDEDISDAMDAYSIEIREYGDGYQASSNDIASRENTKALAILSVISKIESGK